MLEYEEYIRLYLVWVLYWRVSDRGESEGSQVREKGRQDEKVGLRGTTPRSYVTIRLVSKALP